MCIRALSGVPLPEFADTGGTTEIAPPLAEKPFLPHSKRKFALHHSTLPVCTADQLKHSLWFSLTPPPPPNTINTTNEARFRLNVDYGERAQSTVLTRAPPRLPARPRRDFIFNFSMRESKASPVVVCLHHAGGRRHFRLGGSSSVGHCCQHFWVGWGPNRIKGGLHRGKCQRDKQALKIFLGQLQLDDADVVVYKGSKTQRPCCRAVERACFGCARSVALVTSINMAGGACKCGVGSLVHRRKFDRSHSDAAVLCAGVSFSWARPTEEPNESWVSRRIW